MLNTVYIRNVSYNDAKKALQQWLTLYSDDLTHALSFGLYKDDAGYVVLKADEKLSNEHFAFLVNYLNYPEGINYKAEINGYTIIGAEKFFPLKLLGHQIMLFIPDSDTEYDNVYWVTEDNHVYKTDFGGKTAKVDLPNRYAEPETIKISSPDEVLQTQVQPVKKKENEEEDSIVVRFNILCLIAGIALIAGLFVYKKNVSSFNILITVTSLVMTTWFITDHKMLRVNKYYYFSLIAASVFILYGYLILLTNSSISLLAIPMVFLLVQKSIRHFFKTIMKREPVIEKPMPTFADFIYFLSLLLFTILGMVIVIKSVI